MFSFDFPIVFIIFSISIFFYSQIFMTISTFSFLYPISITLDHYLSNNVFAQMPDIKKTHKTIMPSLSLFNLIKHGPVTGTLALSMPFESGPLKFSTAAAIVGGSIYVLGFLASFWLPEPHGTELQE